MNSRLRRGRIMVGPPKSSARPLCRTSASSSPCTSQDVDGRVKYRRRPSALRPAMTTKVGSDGMHMSSFPERLIAGYRTFASQRLPTEQSRYRELSERGQSPQVMVIGCCNSRVSPEVIFDAEPGELFVVRNVANIVPPYAPDGAAHGVSAALEFGVQVLRVKHIVVLGPRPVRRHQSAGAGVGAAVARRLHRQLDGAADADAGSDAAGRGRSRAGFHNAAGEGRGRAAASTT